MSSYNPNDTLTHLLPPSLLTNSQEEEDTAHLIFRWSYRSYLHLDQLLITKAGEEEWGSVLLRPYNPFEPRLSQGVGMSGLSVHASDFHPATCDNITINKMQRPFQRNAQRIRREYSPPLSTISGRSSVSLSSNTTSSSSGEWIKIQPPPLLPIQQWTTYYYNG
jgi:hypothetical protein